jgi:sugar/nucleoside kinase (ribokinase family)
MSIVVVGSIAFDDVITKKGEARNSIGGSALYFSAAASVFSPVSMIGVVGDDFPREHLESLKSRGVDVDGVEVIPGGKTFRWTGEYEEDMNRRTTRCLELNVFKEFNPLLSDKARRSNYVFLGNIDPDIQLAVLDQMESPSFTAADTIESYIQDKPERFRKVLKRVNAVFMNDSEACLFSGKSNILQAAREILAQGPEYVIIKKGEHGSILVSKNSCFCVPAYPVENVLDPTGAGDSYAGGAIGYIAKRGAWDFATLKKAIVYGGLVASFLVEGFSTEKLDNLTIEALEKRMDHFRIITHY